LPTQAAAAAGRQSRQLRYPNTGRAPSLRFFETNVDDTRLDREQRVCSIKMSLRNLLADMASPHRACVCERIAHTRWRLRMIARSFLATCLLCLACVTSHAQSGIASIYAYSGAKTASGERASPGALTAAHRTLPFGTRVRVTNKRNGHSVVVRINDRGPFTRGRVIDVTPAAARVLGFSGLTQVSLSTM
jgi:rare lipoprotein A